MNSDRALECVNICQAMANDKGVECSIIIGSYGQLKVLVSKQVRSTDTVIERCRPVVSVDIDKEFNAYMTLKQICQEHGFESVKSAAQALGRTPETLNRWKKTNFNLLLTAMAGLRARRTI